MDLDGGCRPLASSSGAVTAIDLAETSGSDFVSLLGRPRCETFWQGTIALTLVQILALLYPLRRVNDPEHAKALAHGAFMLIRRSLYDRVGGIGSVRGEIVEDIKFATRIKAEGGKIQVAAAPVLSQTHMYGGFGDIWRGLRKNAYAGMDYQLHKFVTGALLGLLMVWGPLLAMLTGLLGFISDKAIVPGALAWIAVGLVGWIAQAASTVPVVVFLEIPWAFAFSLPAGLVAYIGITTSSVWHYLRGRVFWKDRQFSTEVVSSQSPTND